MVSEVNTCQSSFHSAVCSVKVLRFGLCRNVCHPAQVSPSKLANSELNIYMVVREQNRPCFMSRREKSVAVNFSVRSCDITLTSHFTHLVLFQFF